MSRRGLRALFGHIWPRDGWLSGDGDDHFTKSISKLSSRRCPSSQLGSRSFGSENGVSSVHSTRPAFRGADLQRLGGEPGLRHLRHLRAKAGGGEGQWEVWVCVKSGNLELPGGPKLFSIFSVAVKPRCKSRTEPQNSTHTTTHVGTNGNEWKGTKELVGSKCPLKGGAKELPGVLVGDMVASSPRAP